MWLDQVSEILLPLQWKGNKPNKDIWNINVLKLIYVNKYKFLEINSFFPKAGHFRTDSKETPYAADLRCF